MGPKVRKVFETRTSIALNTGQGPSSSSFVVIVIVIVIIWGNGGRGGFFFWFVLVFTLSMALAKGSRHRSSDLSTDNRGASSLKTTSYQHLFCIEKASV